MSKKTTPTPAESSVFAITAALGVSERRIRIGDREFHGNQYTQREKIERVVTVKKVQEYSDARQKELREKGLTKEQIDGNPDPEGFEQVQRISLQFFADVLNKRIADSKPPIDVDFLLDNYTGSTADLGTFFETGKSPEDLRREEERTLRLLGEDPNA